MPTRNHFVVDVKRPGFATPARGWRSGRDFPVDAPEPVRNIAPLPQTGLPENTDCPDRSAVPGFVRA